MLLSCRSILLNADAPELLLLPAAGVVEVVVGVAAGAATANEARANRKRPPPCFSAQLAGVRAYWQRGCRHWTRQRGVPRARVLLGMISRMAATLKLTR